MSIQKCANCGHQFKWNEIFNSLLLFYKPIKCSMCRTKYKVCFSSRLIYSFTCFASVSPVLLFLSINHQLPSWIACLILTASLLTPLLFPFYAKYYPLQIED
ncbi:TIGR04104 family putative zinc finger protein [Domibacillus aminovorans]|uniref:TIGR04104 family putative zinc finger protein n=1 Tax=Domibacillus aminovorans TaxID=29332 RepID=UPI0009EE7A05